MASKKKTATDGQTLRIGSRVRCTDDGVTGRIVWANGVSVKIKWTTAVPPRAEGETAYGPDLLLRLEARRPSKNKPAVQTAIIEKDRTGVLAGQTIAWPTYDNIAKLLLGLLGGTHVAPASDDEVGQQDDEALARQESERTLRSAELAAQYTACFGLASGIAELERMARELTPKVKSELEAKDLAHVRKAYATRLGQLKAEDAASYRGNEQAEGAVPHGAA